MTPDARRREIARDYMMLTMCKAMETLLVRVVNETGDHRSVARLRELERARLGCYSAGITEEECEETMQEGVAFRPPPKSP